MKPPVPANEKQRLKILWQYELLDTVPEQVFDDLTELAARICEAPIALITLVDENRQWFKSKLGVTINQTSRDVSFCGHAINYTDLFIIPDATKDERFADNPLVTSDPKIRFYAGAPLVTPDGHALGTLCVIDQIPRELRHEQKQAMRVLARHVMTQLELRRHALELARERKTSEKTVSDLQKVRAELAEVRTQLKNIKSKSKSAARKPVRKKKSRK